MSSKFRRKNKQIVSRREFNNILVDITESDDNIAVQEFEIREHEQEITQLQEQLNINVEGKINDLTDRVKYLEDVILQLVNMKIS